MFAQGLFQKVFNHRIILMARSISGLEPLRRLDIDHVFRGAKGHDVGHAAGQVEMAFFHHVDHEAADAGQHVTAG